MMEYDNKIERAKSFIKKAIELQNDGKIDDAIDLYLLSIETYPTPEAYTYLARSYSFKGEYFTAIDECKKAIELDPEYGSPYNDIGLYLMATGNLDEAEVWFEQALSAKHYTQRHLPYFNLGRLMEKKGDWTEAQIYYSKSIDQNHDFLPAKVAFSRLNSWQN